MWKRILLAVWLLAMILPTAWLVSYWPPAQRFFDGVFGPFYMHVISHAALFAVLAFLVAWLLRARFSGWRLVLATLGIVLLAGLAQEGFQLLYKARPLAFDDAFDLGVDVAGGAMGSAVGWLAATRGVKRET
jgi:hypothetical protein